MSVVRETPAHEADVRPTELWAVFPARARSVGLARRALSEWLDGLRWSMEARTDIVLAVDEAIANVVDHAYPPGVPGQARLYAWEVVEPRLWQRRVVVVVGDCGRWKSAAVDPGYRGRGLLIMSECTDSLQVEPSPGGTTVIMTSAATGLVPELVWSSEPLVPTASSP